jgi:guanosine-3',5'-bis(diphosphate) 3'-pyrophosphohydrolase
MGHAMPTFPLFSPLVEQSLRVAADAHRDQTRKASNIPYLTHPAAVALILCRAGFANDDELLAAAVLHDVVEDTDWTIDAVTAEFPARVVAIVDATSEEKDDASGRKIPWRTRKEAHISALKSGNDDARAVTLADKLHNLGTMVFDLDAGHELWSRFGAGPEDIIWYHRTMLAAVGSTSDPRLAALAEECHKLVDRLAADVGVPD